MLGKVDAKDFRGYSSQLPNKMSYLTGDEEMMETLCTYLEALKGRGLRDSVSCWEFLLDCHISGLPDNPEVLHLPHTQRYSDLYHCTPHAIQDKYWNVRKEAGEHGRHCESCTAV